jgi:hypothetical protein
MAEFQVGWIGCSDEIAEPLVGNDLLIDPEAFLRTAMTGRGYFAATACM